MSDKEIFQKLISEFFFYKCDKYFYTCLLKMLREDLSIAGDVLYEKAREEIIIAMRLDWQDNKRNWFISYINALCLKTSNRLCNNKVLQIIIKKMQMYGLDDDSDTIRTLLEASPSFYDIVSSYSEEYIDSLKKGHLKYFLKRCVSVQKHVAKRSVTEDNLYYFYQDVALLEQETNGFKDDLRRMYACKSVNDEKGYYFYRNSFVSSYIYKFKNCVIPHVNFSVSIEDLIQGAALYCIEVLDKYDGKNIDSFVKSLPFRLFFYFSKCCKSQPYEFSYERMLEVIGMHPEREKDWFNTDAVETYEDYLVGSQSLNVAELFEIAQLTSLQKEAILRYHTLNVSEQTCAAMAQDMGISRACLYERINSAEYELQKVAFRQLRIDDNVSLSLCSLLQCSELEKQRLLYGFSFQNKIMQVLQKMFGKDYSEFSDFKKLDKKEYALYFDSIDILKQILQVMREYDHTCLKDILCCSAEEFSLVIQYLQNIRWGYNVMQMIHGVSFDAPVIFDTLDFQSKCTYVRYLLEMQEFLMGLRMSCSGKEDYLEGQIRKRKNWKHKKKGLKIRY